MQNTNEKKITDSNLRMNPIGNKTDRKETRTRKVMYQFQNKHVKRLPLKKYPNSISNTERFVEIHHPPGAIQKVKG